MGERIVKKIFLWFILSFLFFYLLKASYDIISDYSSHLFDISSIILLLFFSLLISISAFFSEKYYAKKEMKNMFWKTLLFNVFIGFLLSILYLGLLIFTCNGESCIGVALSIFSIPLNFILYSIFLSLSVSSLIYFNKKYPKLFKILFIIFIVLLIFLLVFCVYEFTVYYLSAKECDWGKDHSCLAIRAVETNDLSYCDKSTNRMFGIYKCYEEVARISDMDVSSVANCNIINEVFGGTTICTPGEVCTKIEGNPNIETLQFNSKEICCLKEGKCIPK